MKFAYQDWRRQWGYNRFCGGALVWQLNDCWPGTSWSIVDYYHRKKPAYYTIKRALCPMAIGVRRTYHDWSVDHARPAKTSKYEVWISSDARRNSATSNSHSNSKIENNRLLSATVKLRFISISSGKDIHPPIRKERVAIVPNGTTDVLRGVIDNVKDEPHVLAATLIIDGKMVSRDTDFPQPLKYLDFSDRGVRVEMVLRSDDCRSSGDYNGDNGNSDGKGNGDDAATAHSAPAPIAVPAESVNSCDVTERENLFVERFVVTATKPTKGLVFEERDGVTLSDSGFDLVPGDGDDNDDDGNGNCNGNGQYIVHVRGLRASDEPLNWRYLGQ